MATMHLFDAYFCSAVRIATHFVHITFLFDILSIVSSEIYKMVMNTCISLVEVNKTADLEYDKRRCFEKHNTIDDI